MRIRLSCYPLINVTHQPPIYQLFHQKYVREACNEETAHVHLKSWLQLKFFLSKFVTPHNKKPEPTSLKDPEKLSKVFIEM